VLSVRKYSCSRAAVSKNCFPLNLPCPKKKFSEKKFEKKKKNRTKRSTEKKREQKAKREKKLATWPVAEKSVVHLSVKEKKRKFKRL
jgi:hypothetical protein